MWGFGFETKLLVIKVPNPYIAQELFLYSNDTCLYTILLSDPILGERELCMSIAQFTPKSVATELCEYMWILCFLIVTKKMCF